MRQDQQVQPPRSIPQQVARAIIINCAKGLQQECMRVGGWVCVELLQTHVKLSPGGVAQEVARAIILN